MRKRRGETHEEISPNLTPLIDVVFVILIMFIVMAPLLEIDRVELASGPSSKSVQQEQNLVIHVFADDTVSFNKQPVSMQELERLLTSAHTRYPMGHPQVIHDRRATFGTYQAIKAAVESAGFSEMDVLLKPQ